MLKYGRVTVSETGLLPCISDANKIITLKAVSETTERRDVTVISPVFSKTYWLYAGLSCTSVSFGYSQDNANQ